MCLFSEEVSQWRGEFNVKLLYPPSPRGSSSQRAEEIMWLASGASQGGTDGRVHGASESAVLGKAVTHVNGSAGSEDSFLPSFWGLRKADTGILLRSGPRLDGKSPRPPG